jgi:hemerythrin superfamily protein
MLPAAASAREVTLSAGRGRFAGMLRGRTHLACDAPMECKAPPTCRKETREMKIQTILPRMAGEDDDALKLLEREHAAVTELFESYPKLTDPGDKETLVARILVELVIHARVEEGLFYPALRRAQADAALIDESEVERDAAKALMQDLHGIKADAPRYDAKLSVLARLVKDHIEEEEGRIFEAARGSDLDLSALGSQMNAYRAALRVRYELDIGSEELADYLSVRAVVGAPESRVNGTPARSPMERARGPQRDARIEPSAPKPGPAKPRTRAVETTGQRRSRRSNRASAGNS